MHSKQQEERQQGVKTAFYTNSLQILHTNEGGMASISVVS